mmetsp:Transcript_50716/g.101319  ORF Transcript_50716/g.101319 Transcript_50716/m.101319 type:complete len:209 (+) Transcript_50716:893-1519(+)
MGLLHVLLAAVLRGVVPGPDTAWDVLDRGGHERGQRSLHGGGRGPESVRSQLETAVHGAAVPGLRLRLLRPPGPPARLHRSLPRPGPGPLYQWRHASSWFRAHPRARRLCPARCRHRHLQWRCAGCAHARGSLRGVGLRQRHCARRSTGLSGCRSGQAAVRWRDVVSQGLGRAHVAASQGQLELEARGRGDGGDTQGGRGRRWYAVNQ